MKTQNDNPVYIKSFGDMIEIIHIAKSVNEANEFCEKHKTAGVIDESGGLIFIANIDELVKECKKWFVTQCKNKTLFRLLTDKEGAWHVINTPFTKNVKSHLVKKYGDSLVEIANETKI